MTSNMTFKPLLSSSFSFFYLHRFLFAKITFVCFVFLLCLGKLIHVNIVDRELILFFGSYYNSVSWIVSGLAVYVICTYVVAMVVAILKLRAGEVVILKDCYRLAVKKAPQFTYVLLVYVLKVFSWSLVFVLPGIFFAIFYSGCFCAYCLDGVPGEEALNVSKAIIKKSFHKYCDYLLLYVLIVLVTCMPLFYILDYAIYTFIKDKNIISGVVVNLFQLGVFGYLISFSLVFYVFLYLEMKARFERGEKLQSQESVEEVKL